MFVADNSPDRDRALSRLAARSRDTTPQQITSTQTVTSAWLSDPTLNGALLTSLDANAYDTSTPAIAAFQAALKEVRHRAQP